MDAKSKERHAVAKANKQPPELSVVIPTFNERDNIHPLLDRLATALDGIHWEAIFVDDDSPDGTADRVREIAQQNPRVRVIRRIGRRGLGTACVEGALSSSAPYFAVIDADMQHDEAILPQMLERLKQDDLDIVVGSRYAAGGSVGGWDERRQAISRMASQAAHLIIKSELRDPMSGFFLMRRTAFDEAVRSLSQQGFKILLDLFASAPRPLRFAEISYHFRVRKHGESKLDTMAAWEYCMLLADKLFGYIIPARLIVFGIVGSLGLIVHILALRAALSFDFAFLSSQSIASVASIGFNFILNNLITYRDSVLRGWPLVRGALAFYAISSFGLAANINVARLAYAEAQKWWIAGLSGAIIGVIWNYTMSSFLVWTRK